MARTTVSCSRAAVTPAACSRSNISPPVCAPYTVHSTSSPHHPPFPHVGTTKWSLLQGPGGDGSEITAEINRFWLETNICRWELPASMAQHSLVYSSSGLGREVQFVEPRFPICKPVELDSHGRRKVHSEARQCKGLIPKNVAYIALRARNESIEDK